jgi:hypothetical protein
MAVQPLEALKVFSSFNLPLDAVDLYNGLAEYPERLAYLIIVIVRIAKFHKHRDITQALVIVRSTVYGYNVEGYGFILFIDISLQSPCKQKTAVITEGFF